MGFAAGNDKAGGSRPLRFWKNMDLIDFVIMNLTLFRFRPPDFRVQRTPCRVLSSGALSLSSAARYIDFHLLRRIDVAFLAHSIALSLQYYCWHNDFDLNTGSRNFRRQNFYRQHFIGIVPININSVQIYIDSVLKYRIECTKQYQKKFVIN